MSTQVGATHGGTNEVVLRAIPASDAVEDYRRFIEGARPLLEA